MAAGTALGKEAKGFIDKGQLVPDWLPMALSRNALLSPIPMRLHA